jgi:ADP-ribose pyrophosphatase YjhB (NUDIX family)
MFLKLPQPESNALASMNFCPECGAQVIPHTIGGETRNHWYCTQCAEPRYRFPMVVVTCFIAWGKRLLWVQRNIEPKRGSWAIPGGFLECGETLAQGAARELREESGVVVAPEALALYMTGTITFIDQVFIAFRAEVDSGAVNPGSESMAARFFDRSECPWGEVAYPEVNDAIEQAYDDLDAGTFNIWQTEMGPDRYFRAPVSERL